MKKSRSGIRKLNQRLNHPLNRRLGQLTMRRLDGRRWRRPNYLAQACSALNQYLRLQRKLARDHPHLYGSHARRYYLDTLALEKFHQEIDDALRKIYGPCADDADQPARRVWTERYVDLPSKPRFFRKWFHETYGS